MDMKQIAQNWLIPPSVYKWGNYYLYKINSFFRKDFRKVLRQNVSLIKESNSRERCFIIGSGPSLKKTNLKILKNEVCLLLNHTYLYEDFNLIENKFCVFSGFACHDASQEDISHCLYHLSVHARDVKLILNIEDRDIFESCNLNIPKLRYYFDWSLNWSCLNRVKLRCDQPICPPQNSVIFAIQVALCMKFKSIYLVGVDHDFILSALTRSQEKHFYTEAQEKLLNRFVDIEIPNIASYLAAHSLIWNQHMMLNLYAKNLGISIFNAPQGGILDVYPRVSLENLTS
ncbi:hypothetical protein ACRYJJ_04290 [Cylindrospermopsis raciborskii G7]|uniref:hypothetical protein n=1 Tax=Cylindrospermopsis raciborskii TaxID=77022 RepID=UPI003EBBACB8